jgi:putative tryptophan/tyrosine transport system substrate-binding protein
MKRRDFIVGLGSAAAWPVAAWGQRQAVPVIGFLNGGGVDGFAALLRAFHQGLGEQGYVEGRSVDILYRWADAQYDRLPAMAADLVRRQVAVIFATSGAAAVLAAKAATVTIPIVFQLGTDPVKFGLVASLNRPGGNLTGVTFLTTALVAKRLQLLHEIVPAATSVGFLVNPMAPQAAAEIAEAETAANALGVRLVIFKASTPDEIDAALTSMVEQRIGALLIGADPLFYVQTAPRFVRNPIPTIWNTREMVDAGGLVSYGASFSDSYRLAGGYVGRILKGEKPADLPVQQSTKLELVVSLKNAKALGLTIPISLLGRADEIIE